MIRMYANDHQGVARSRESARLWYKKAAESGNSEIAETLKRF
jgi:TPR repeat protein